MSRRVSTACARGAARSSGTLRHVQRVALSSGPKRADALLNAIDDIVRRRRAGSETYGVRLAEPRRAQVRLGLDVVDAGTIAPARLHQLTRVVAGLPTDDDHDVRCARQFDGGVLSLFGRLAHRVEEADFRAREPPPDRRGQMPHLLD